MPKRRSLTIEIRDGRLRGGRLLISARTTSAPMQRRREAAVRSLLELGEYAIIERLRAGIVRIEDVQRAHDTKDWNALREQSQRSLRLGDVCDRQHTRVNALLTPGGQEIFVTLKNQLLERWGADKDITTITIADAEAFLHEPKKQLDGKKAAKPWAPRTQEARRVRAASMWQKEIEAEAEAAALTKSAPRLTLNPWKKAEVPRDYQQRVAYLQPEEWAALDQYVAENHPHRRILFALGVLAGLRLGEALHLRVGIDIDMPARKLIIQKRGGEYAWRPKNQRGSRDVPISDELYERLVYHMEHFAGKRYLIRAAGKDRPMSHLPIQRLTNLCMSAVGLQYGRDSVDGLTFHSTRHTFASWAAQQRYTTMEIAEIIGDTEREVSRTYAHLAPKNLREVVAGVSAKSQHLSSVSSSEKKE